MSRNTTIAYLIFSVLFITITFFPEPRAFWMFKIFPILLLLIEVSEKLTFSKRYLLMGALATSAVGDILLHLNFFVPGLTAFLIAQVQYSVIFSRYWKSIKHRLSISIGLVFYLAVALILLLPNLGEMMIPVIAYLLVIAMMGFFAIQSNLSMKWAVLGALLFILSDSFIAVNKFIIELPLERLLVMSTYYTAQWMLVDGFLNEPNMATSEVHGDLSS